MTVSPTVSAPTVVDVRIVITTSGSDDQVQTAINDAVLLASRCASVSQLSDDLKAAIYKYIAAHILATQPGGQSNRVLTQRSLGDASESFAAPMLGFSLQGTQYGQMACSLEGTGCLANIGKTRARFTAVRNI